MTASMPTEISEILLPGACPPQATKFPKFQYREVPKATKKIEEILVPGKKCSRY